jgi:TrmH family RNA methyltransferase
MISKTHTKYIQSLQHKKFRDEHGQFVAEGPKTLNELLEGGKFFCQEVYATEDWLADNDKFTLLNPKTKFEVVQDFELEKISGFSSPNKVLGVFEKRNYHSEIDFKGKITLLLDTIQDPGNLGTIIRIADWFGIETIICSGQCAEMYNPKVVQSTMGSLGRVNILYEELETWISQNKTIRTYAAALNGTPINDLKKMSEAAIIIGNESKGIHEELLDSIEEKITIPRIGEAESLNAAVATGILLSHVIGV